MRNDAKKLTCDVLDILWKRTDQDHPISIRELTEALAGRCDTPPDRGTVASILKKLHDHYGGPGRVRCRETEKRDEHTYPYRWYLERELTGEDAAMLISDVVFSRMRTEQQAKALIEKLRGLVSPYESRALEHAQDLPCALYTASPLVQHNLVLVQRAISGNLHRTGRETVVSFRFNGYGSDGRLHELPNGHYQNVLPLRILENDGRFYLICLLDKKSSPSHFRLDLITRLSAAERPKPADPRRERVIRRMNGPDARAAYLAKHLYMGYEREGESPGPVCLRVKKIPGKPDASLTILHDAFGRSYRLDFENDRYADVWVEGIPWSITAFVQQHLGRVRVLGPEQMKLEVEKALQENYKEYFRIPEKGGE